MPRFNPFTAEAVMGVGNGPLSVNGHLLRGDGGGPSAWYDRDHVLHQIGDQLARTNVRSGVGGVIGPGVNEISAAGTGTYLAWGANDGLFGAITSREGGLNRVITDGRGANSPDGCLVYIANRQGNGPTVVRHPAGLEMHLPDMYGMHLLKWGEAVWNAGSGLDFWGQRADFLPGAGYAKQADVRGERWIVYFLEGVGLIAHRGVRPDVYYVVTESPNCYHYDVIAFDDKLMVCWSATTGEGPSHLVKQSDVLANCATRPYASPATDPVLDPLPRRMLIAPYKSHTAQYGPTPDHAGNLVLTDPPEAHLAGNWPLILGGIDPLPTNLVNRTWATYAHGTSIEDLASKTIRMREKNPTKPCIAYLDKGSFDDWPRDRPNWITEHVRPNGQLYRNPGESLAAFDDRGSRLLQRLNSYGVWFGMTPAFYTRNEINGVPVVPVNEIVACMPLYERWIRQFERLVDFLPFADMRPTGMQQHPIFRKLAKAFLKANPGLPAIGDYGGDNGGGDSMRIVIHSFDKECNRSDPHGHGIDFEIEEPPIPCHVTVGLDDGEQPMGFTIFTERKNGHYFRGVRHKPGVNGHHPVVIKVLDRPDLTTGRVLAETRSTGTVRVFVGGSDNGDDLPLETQMEILNNQYPLIRQVRIDLYPQLYQPGHPEANGDGFLRIDGGTPGQPHTYNEPLGLERGAAWMKEAAKRIKAEHPGVNVGVARAKSGSANIGGKNPPITTDIIVQGDNGAHWDCQVDSAGDGFPSCSLVDQFWTNPETGDVTDNWANVKPRFVPASQL